MICAPGRAATAGRTAGVALAAFAAALWAIPPSAFGSEEDRDEGESRTGRVSGPDECKEGKRSREYEDKLEKWRRPRKLKRHRWVRGFREVTFRNIHTNRDAKLVLFDDDGNVAPEAAEKVRWIWNNSGVGDGKAVRDRLIKILYFTAVKFDVNEIVIISGWRDDREQSVTSPHWHGRGADIIVPGVSNQRVIDYVRKYGKVGVGTYPVSGFIHVDVRERSFFWRDVSGPGQPSCYYEIDRDIAREYDANYRESRDDPRRLRGYRDYIEQKRKRRRR